nr:6'deoxychalcone 4'-O-glucosyltransferase [Dahlia pinnata]
MASSTIIMYPSPPIGHLVSMVEIGKLIHTHHPSLSIIILIIPAPYETGSTDKYINSVSTTNPSITFHHLPNTPLPPDSSSDFLDLLFDIPNLYNPVLHDTLVSISQKSTIKAVILDCFTNPAFQVSKSLNLPTYYFHTGAASDLCVMLYFSTIHKTIYENIKDLDISFNIPGIPKIHSSYMPAAIAYRESNTYKNFLKVSINVPKCCGIIVNTFSELEERAVEAIRDGKCVTDGPTPPVYFVGPLIASGDKADDVEENECLKWLKTQPRKSVVFLCFGSLGVFNKEQLAEIAVGLEKSGKRFLWVVRDPMRGAGGKEFDVDEILPEGFLSRTKDMGLVVKNWAPQLAILGHESVGGFVSHCGWNSSLEAVVSGVPMVAWPLYAEQKMNRVFLVEELKVAFWLEMSADGFVSAKAVDKTIRKLMDGEEGRAMRERISEMSGKAKAAVEEGGSSRVDFLKVTQPWTGL